jgi:hypothetical protein
MVKLETMASSEPIAWTEGRTEFAVLVRVTAPAQCSWERHRLDLVAVLDTSGSMGNDGKLERMQHAMEFVIDNLGGDDRLSIVPFRNTENDHARCPLTLMSAENRENLKLKVNMLQSVNNAGDDEGAANEAAKVSNSFLMNMKLYTQYFTSSPIFRLSKTYISFTILGFWVY